MPEQLLAVSLHDVAPATWPACRRVIAAVQEVAPVPMTLLVVPAYHGQCSALAPDFVAALCVRATVGGELALHGYFHRDAGTAVSVVDWFWRRVYTQGEGEFSALSTREATERLLLGQRWFRANGWPLAGFVPPAWLLGSEAWRAVRATPGLLYATTFRHFHLLADRRAVPAPCFTLSTRSPWRRLLARAWVATAPRAIERAQVVRLALHPNDADDPGLRRGWQSVLERWLLNRTALTKAAIARRLSHQGAGPAIRQLASRDSDHAQYDVELPGSGLRSL